MLTQSATTRFHEPAQGSFAAAKPGVEPQAPGRKKRKRSPFEARRSIMVAGAVLALGVANFGVFAQGKMPRGNIPEAPLPTAVVSAKRVFLRDGQTTSEFLTKNGNALAFDSLYAQMKGWGKYTLVDSPKDADIIIELQYRPYAAGSRSFGMYSPSSQTINTRSVVIPAADFALVLYDAKSREQLWSVTDACRAARRVKNQQKEVVKSIGRLVEDLRIRGVQ